MFLLYAVALGVLAGFLTGGRPSGLGALPVRWPAVALAGLAFQVVLFTDAVAGRVGDLGPPLYVGSTLVVLAAIVRNADIPGIRLVVAGAVSNLAAILANGGYMPASLDALTSLGKGAPEIYSNSSVVPAPVLEPLTDIFALPAWLPGANVFSVGDILIGFGMALVIVLAMHRPAAASAASTPSTGGLAGSPGGAAAH